MIAAKSKGLARPVLGNEHELSLRNLHRPVELLAYIYQIEIDMSADTLLTPEHKVRWRMSLALGLWVGGFFLPLAIPLVTGLPLPVATKTLLSGLLIFGLPQVLTVIAIAIVGKSGFHYLKDRLFGVAKKFGPPAHVSRLRYRIGLVMLFLPLAVSLLEPYITLLVVWEHLPHWVYGAVNDTLFLASFFVLGGEFWDKVKALFIYEAKVTLPGVPVVRIADATAVES
jgi:hypothetical protein